MKRIWKQFSIVMSALIISLLCQTTVFAVDSLEFHMEQSVVDENGLKIYVNTSIDRDDCSIMCTPCQGQ